MITRTKAMRLVTPAKISRASLSESGAPATGGLGRSSTLDQIPTEATVSPASPNPERPETPRECSIEHSNVSLSSRSRVSSSRSSATIKAHRLSAEAQLARRSLEREQLLLEREQQFLEREKSLAQQQQQIQREQELARHRLNCERKVFEQMQRVEELEAEATLAAQEIDELSTHTVSQSCSRTASWVYDKNHSSRPVDIKVDANVPDTTTDAGAAMINVNPGRNMGLEPNYTKSQNVNINPGTPYFSREHDFHRNEQFQSHGDYEKHKAVNHEIHGHIYKNPVTFHIPVNHDDAKLFQTTSKKALSFTRPSVNSIQKECHSLSKQPEMNIYSQKCSHKLELTPFSGKTTEWLMFKRIYRETQHLFTPAENLLRLSGALRGQALESVSSSRSSATIKARRLSAEAQLARRSLEREQLLLEREQQFLEREKSLAQQQQQIQREQELARHRLNCERKVFEQMQRVEELEAEATLAAQEIDELSTHTVTSESILSRYDKNCQVSL